jgi:hypothetical protein
MKDAAVQAYMALYREGLLNDNLLRLNRERMMENDEREGLPSTIQISEQFNPWVNSAKALVFSSDEFCVNQFLVEKL